MTEHERDKQKKALRLNRCLARRYAEVGYPVFLVQAFAETTDDCAGTPHGAPGKPHFHDFVAQASYDSDQVEDLFEEYPNSAPAICRLLADPISNQKEGY